MHFVSKRKKPEAVMLRAGDELGREKGVIALDVGGCCVAAFFQRGFAFETEHL